MEEQPAAPADGPPEERPQQRPSRWLLRNTVRICLEPGETFFNSQAPDRPQQPNAFSAFAETVRRRRELELRGGSPAGRARRAARAEAFICMAYSECGVHYKCYIGRRRKNRMRHAFLCVAYGMLHKGLHANPLRCITLGLWFGGRLPADLGALGLGHGAPELAAARQRRGRSAASAEAIDVHGVWLYDKCQIGRRIK